MIKHLLNNLKMPTQKNFVWFITCGLLFFNLFFGAGNAYCQTYPVQISTQLVPPYSGYLPDYADPASEKLKIIIQFNDFSVPHYNLKLKFEIKGNGFTLSTKTFYNPPPITLAPGQPLLLSSLDLAHYLNTNNLDFVGYNQFAYEQRMALPEGYYSICVKAYDYYSSPEIQVSNEGCAQAWFTLSDPPFLNLPICNSIVKPLTPQNILFQWTPMNLGSPLSALNTEYEFALWECRPDSNANPNQIVLSTAPVFSITTQQTFFNYSLSEPPLNQYMKYVWRVRAKDNTGRDWFKNQGCSQICTFTYGSVANVLGNAINLTLNAQSISHRTGQCDWTKQTAFTNYILQVRKQGTNYWFDYPNISGIEKVSNLEPNTTYQCRVHGEGNGFIGNWSNTAIFTTAGPPNYSCNDQGIPNSGPAPLPLPLNKAVCGLIIQSGQFEVFTTHIEPSGAPGWYKGRGYTLIFGLKKIAVKWDNIYIDIDNRQQQGIIQALTNGIDKWLNQWDMSMAEENATYINGAIDSVFVKGNQICYTLKGEGNAICIPTPTNTNVKVIRDGEGNQYTINLIPPPPKITGPTNYLNYSNDSLGADDSHIVYFEAAATQNFGFDKKQYAAFIKDYETIKLKNGKNYFVPNKSIGQDATDEVNARLQINNFSTNFLSFKTKNGSVLSVSSTSIENVVKITGIPANSECIYAWYKNKKIGKLNVSSLKAIAKKVVLVPVNGSPIAGGITPLIKSIFNQANVTFNVTTAPNFTFNLGNDGLEAADANLLSKYSGEMRRLRDAYKLFDTLYDKSAYYLFVVSNFTNPDLKGYMVRGKALGFITANANVKEIAHELAHGAFGLEHTFPGLEKNTSNNLMDYTNGSQLVKSQWDMIQFMKLKLSWFDDEEDAEFTGHKVADKITVFETLKQIKNCNNHNISMPVTHFWDGRHFGFRAENIIIGGIHYSYVFIYKDLTGYPKKASVNPKNNISSEEKIGYYAMGDNIPYGLIKVDNVMYVEVSANRRLDMENYLKSPESKNLLLFVNGYRNNISLKFDEYPNSMNKVQKGDIFDYWAGLDGKFMNRIGVQQAVYADGHHGIVTSNHLNQAYFLLSLKSSNDITLPTILNTIPNVDGFNARLNYGKVAGNDLLTQINNGSVTFNKTNDSLYVVCHSMGFAYAQGMIEILRLAGVKVKRYYILAPENGCSGTVDVESFEEVWQYGTDEINDPPKQRDGVAPQCKVNGLLGNKRVYIPDGEPKDFLNCHYINNYYWVFDIRNKFAPGYVHERK